MYSCGEAGEEAQRIGFAIPSSTVTCIADQFVEDGKVTSRGRAALVVVTVADGGPAVEAPSRPGDIVTAPDATPITAVQVLAEALAARSPGDKHSLNSYRAGGPTPRSRPSTRSGALGCLRAFWCSGRVVPHGFRCGRHTDSGGNLACWPDSRGTCSRISR
ncbi:PDZ domain-containing protein [Streptomyces albogriseolus]|uniref:PDZ domain-containing protein n=1 Tax=Streptomyces albogriseolus TaxID=1887 RepID=UPI00346045CB